MNETREFDILSPGFHADPFPTLDQMRAEGSVIHMKLPIIGRTWLAVTHAACAAMLKDHDSFARDPGNAGSKTQARILRVLPRTLSLLALNMLGHDDPEHRRQRGLVDQTFQRRTIEAMKPTIAAIADRLLDRMEDGTEINLMTEFCRDLPLSVICAMLGLPERDHDRFKDWLGTHRYRRRLGHNQSNSGPGPRCPPSSTRIATRGRSATGRTDCGPARCGDGRAEAQRG